MLLLKTYNIHKLLEKCDKKLFKKSSSDSSHPLYPMLPHAKASSLRLGWSTIQLPKINTEHFKSSFFNRLSFRYNLALWEIFTVSALIYLWKISCNILYVFYRMNKDIIVVIITIIISTHFNDLWDTHHINKLLQNHCDVAVGYSVWNIVCKESAWQDKNTWCNAFLGIHPWYLSTLFNPKYPHTNSPDWSLYISLNNQLR